MSLIDVARSKLGHENTLYGKDDDISQLYIQHKSNTGHRLIRVLDIAPQSASQVDCEYPLQARMRVISLDEPHVYNALSYVWGDYGDPPHHLLCDGYPIPVTSNCWSALRQLSSTGDTLVIWVDAICINQRDLVEKSQQVSMMGDIYSHARTTFVWLGDGDEASDRSMLYMRKAGFQEYLRPMPGHLYDIPSRTYLYLHAGITMFIQKCLDTFCFAVSSSNKSNILDPICFNDAFDRQRTLEALENILKRPWISRMWTLQEALLSSDVVFCCGKQQLPLRCMLYTLVFFDATSHGLVERPHTEIGAKWLSFLQLWLHLRTASKFTPMMPSTVDPNTAQSYIQIQYVETLQKIFFVYFILSGTASTTLLCLAAASIPLAYVLGLGFNDGEMLGIFITIAVIVYLSNITLQFLLRVCRTKPPALKDAFKRQHSTVLIQEMRSRFNSEPRDCSFGMHAILKRMGLTMQTPDYDRPLGLVYQDLFICLLEWTSDLNLLLCTSNSDIHPRASWVPDWNARPDTIWGELKSQLPGSDVLRGHSSNGFHGEKPTWYYDAQLGVLVIQGVEIAKVEWTAAPFKAVDEHDVRKNSQNWVFNLGQVSESLVQRLNRRGDRPFEETVRQGSGPNLIGTTITSCSWSDLFNRWPKPSWNVTGPEQTQFMNNLNNYIRGCPGFEGFGFVKHFVFNCESWLWDLARLKRCLFLAGYDGLLGDGPSNVSVGDRIYLLRGVSLPAVLRPKDNRFQLVGFCDLEFMMSSEFWGPLHKAERTGRLEHVVLV